MGNLVGKTKSRIQESNKKKNKKPLNNAPLNCTVKLTSFTIDTSELPPTPTQNSSRNRIQFNAANELDKIEVAGNQQDFDADDNLSRDSFRISQVTTEAVVEKQNECNTTPDSSKCSGSSNESAYCSNSQQSKSPDTAGEVLPSEKDTEEEYLLTPDDPDRLRQLPIGFNFFDQMTPGRNCDKLIRDNFRFKMNKQMRAYVKEKNQQQQLHFE